MIFDQRESVIEPILKDRWMDRRRSGSDSFTWEKQLPSWPVLCSFCLYISNASLRSFPSSSSLSSLGRLKESVACEALFVDMWQLN